MPISSAREKNLLNSFSPFFRKSNSVNCVQISKKVTMVFKSAKDFKEENAAPKPPAMKFRQAAKIADKNSRTIVKIQQLLV